MLARAAIDAMIATRNPNLLVIWIPFDALRVQIVDGDRKVPPADASQGSCSGHVLRWT
jgi:hypothetical protein